MSNKKWPVYAPYEVIIHNTPHDCWVSFLGKVFNLTPLLKHYKGQDCIKPIIAFAGKDLSHWFDDKTGEIQHYVHPITGAEVPYCPHGPIPEVNCQVPSTEWKPCEGRPWWASDKYQIGVLTKCVRAIRIINMFICSEAVINVCCEDTFHKIADRYSIFNSETSSYHWVYNDKMVDMDKTMDENGIPDERDKMSELGIPRSFYIPSVRLYYTDDLLHLEDLTDDEDELDNEICCACKDKEEKNEK